MLIEKEISSSIREEFIDITHTVRKAVEESGIHDGLVTVFVPHTTAGVTINENADPDVRTDIIHGLGSFGFETMDFSHVEGNSSAHIKSTLTGSSVTVILKEGELLLGTWQGIYFCEYDGPRRRKVQIKISGS
ncbi:MAG: secondary thiamine-phosphate synthase enzyme YjbQ [Candidatus Delongbacteria bacterium]|jgi:secondary thiamine-phosphate synthase enzyme|nr:secondary thiamine-phosphate synthase enzyme YjbQ [Candidatus Delongbacteria bacterium]